MRPDDVRQLVDSSLRPLGLLLRADGTEPEVRRSNPLLALRFRRVVTDPAVTRRLTTPFAVLFSPFVVVPVVLAFVAVSGWVLFSQGLAAATAQAFGNPALFLAVVVVTVLSAGFHEFGHAAAARYGGSTPGAMGFGFYLFWPAFYTDVTDSYRLGRAGRVRTDLGGLYFNALVVLLSFGVWWLTGWHARAADRRHPGAADDPAAGAAAALRRLPRARRPHRRARPLPAHRPDPEGARCPGAGTSRRRPR